MLETSLILISLSIVLVAIHSLTHFNIWDSILGMSLVSSLIVMGMILYAAFTDSTMFIDIAITFGLLGFIGTLFTVVFIYAKGDI